MVSGLVCLGWVWGFGFPLMFGFGLATLVALFGLGSVVWNVVILICFVVYM